MKKHRLKKISLKCLSILPVEEKAAFIAQKQEEYREDSHCKHGVYLLNCKKTISQEYNKF